MNIIKENLSFECTFSIICMNIELVLFVCMLFFQFFQNFKFIDAIGYDF